MNIRGVLNIHKQDPWSWYFIPSIILSSSFLFGLILSFLIPVDGNIFIAGISYIFFYMFIAGVIIFHQTFPFAISMSVRRTDYFIGTVLKGLFTCFLFATLYLLLAAIEYFTNGWGGQLDFFHLPYLNAGNTFEQFIVYFLIFANCFFAGFCISAYSKRFGLKGMLIAGLLIFFAATIAAFFLSYLELWMDIFHWVKNHAAVELAYWLIPFIFIYALVSYLLIRKTTV